MGETLRLMLGRGLDAVGLDHERHAPEALPVVEGDACDPPFEDASFDGVVCECVLSLLPSPAKALAAFRRILKPEGRLLLSDLYLPEGGGSSGPARPAPPSCLDGAMSREKTEACLAGAGFRTLVFEDHPEALKELAARLIWYGGISLRDACPAAGGSGRPGYGLWIAARDAVPTEQEKRRKEMPWT